MPLPCFQRFPPVCSVIDELSADPMQKLKPKITIAHIEKLVRTAKTVSDLQPALELLNAARTALDKIEKQKEADFKRVTVEIKKLRVQVQKKIDEKAASKAAEVPNEEGTSKAAQVPNQQENEA
ncbi:uncharacterized protein [Medicago truncatula]|uniref:uncharacterized protein isoform X2 n=1 Tax=Medicago truncatula TaxID=3880 RepID=UPI0019688B74|nr:uncharacterized protein LOC25496921 isoform X2 [Medicago truncatula]